MNSAVYATHKTLDAKRNKECRNYYSSSESSVNAAKELIFFGIPFLDSLAATGIVDNATGGVTILPPAPEPLPPATAASDLLFPLLSVALLPIFFDLG